MFPVIGQDGVKKLLRGALLRGRVPHALLFEGGAGRGKLAMALQYAAALLCERRTAAGKACGECAACRMVGNAAHPDLHFVFPVMRAAGGAAVSDGYLKQWREQLADSPYFTREGWVERLGGEAGGRLQIGVAEAENLQRKLQLSSVRGGYRPVIVWQADAMNVQCANKLLKLLEEPPAHTVFMLLSDHPAALLPTIRSRTQPVAFAPLPEADIAAALVRDCVVGTDDARLVARTAEGSYTRARLQVTAESDTAQFFDYFVLLMRRAYQRDIHALFAWAEHPAKWGRERQKAFLTYALRLVRENFMYNFGLPELTAMNATEAEFAVKFARFVNERNVIGLSEQLSLALRDIEANVNGRMVFTDLTLKMIMLMKAGA